MVPKQPGNASVVPRTSCSQVRASRSQNIVILTRILFLTTPASNRPISKYLIMATFRVHNIKDPAQISRQKSSWEKLGISYLSCKRLNRPALQIIPRGNSHRGKTNAQLVLFIAQKDSPGWLQSTVKIMNHSTNFRASLLRLLHQKVHPRFMFRLICAVWLRARRTNLKMNPEFLHVCEA